MNDRITQTAYKNLFASENGEITPFVFKRLAEKFVSASISVKMRDELILKEAYSTIRGDRNGSERL